MLSIRTLSLQAVAPNVPDFHICDQRYGQNLNPIDCDFARRLMPAGASAVPYAVDTSGARFALPFSMQHGIYGVEIAKSTERLIRL